MYSLISRRFYLVLISYFTSLSCFSQSDEIKTSLAAWQKGYPQEKVFLQADKSYYLPGENIWLKAWCVTDEGPTFLSRILYIDLVDPDGRVVRKKMYQLDSLGSTAADLQLPDDLKSGNYSINAYTLWMLNFPDFIYSKSIFIYGNDYKTYKKTSPQRSTLKLQFFPEGGNIIAGVENRVAFKATDNDGYPLSCNGYIEDQAGKKIIDISTEHDGFGAFAFPVEAGKQYTAVIIAGSSSKLTFKLPTAKAEGIAMQVNNSNASRIFVVLNRAEANSAKYKTLKVVAQLNYQVVYSMVLNLDEGQTAASISKKGLPPGVMQITVFDERNLPIAERLAFIENYQFISPVITTELVDKKAKGKNRINFTTDGEGQPSLSCLVTNYNPSDSILYNEDNITSSLLFGNELRGTINNPGYYLKNKSPETLRHLDLLMMTQGWRRFEWKQVLAKTYPELKYPVESGISFRGSMFKSDRKEVVKDGRVNFVIKGADSTSILAEASVTDKGEFLLSDIHYKKEANVAYMGTNNKKENFIVDVKLLPNYIDSLQRSRFRSQNNLDTGDVLRRNNDLALYLRNGLNSLDSAAKYKELGNVTVRAKKLSHIDSLNQQYAQGPFMMGKAVDPAEYKNYMTIWQMIQAAVPGITVEGNPFDPVVTMNRFGGLANASDATDGSGDQGLNLSVPTLMEENGIALFLNEVNVSKDVINTLSVSDIALIKVLKNEAYALGATQGAIAIYTRTGVGVNARIYDKSFTQERYQGYAIVKEFFSPDYSDPENRRESDNRYTLYWNGKIQPAKDGKYRFEFYNNDFGKSFRVLVQGIDKDGQLYYKEHIIQ